jgi:uncharacterized membrane protein YphA (DoxX/SURF4 family)
MLTLTKILYWAARLLAAVILLQSLYFKFGASAESVYIFTKVGMEPWGRIGTGVVELICSILLVITPTAWIGAGIALALMGGALTMHFTILGIEVQGDGGYLFSLAWIVTVCSLYVLYVNKEKVRTLLRRGH